MLITQRTTLQTMTGRINILDRGVTEGADNTAVIQAAIDELAAGSGGVIEFPKPAWTDPIYYHASTLQWKSGVVARGWGQGYGGSSTSQKPLALSMLKCTSQAVNGIELAWGVKEFGFDGIDVRGGLNAVKMLGENTFWWMRDCFIGDAAQSGFEHDAVEHFNVTNLRINANGGVGWRGGAAGRSFAAGASISNGSTTLTVNLGTSDFGGFSSAHVGQVVTIVGAGPASGGSPTMLVGTISAVTNSTTVTLSIFGGQAVTTVSDVAWTLGSDGRIERGTVNNLRTMYNGSHGLYWCPCSKFQGVGGVTFSAPTSIQDGGHGSYFEQARAVDFLAPNVESPSYGHAGQYDGIHVATETNNGAGACNRFAIVAADNIGSSSVGGGGADMRYSVYLVADGGLVLGGGGGGTDGGLLYGSRTSIYGWSGRMRSYDHPLVGAAEFQRSTLAPLGQPDLSFARWIPGASDGTLTFSGVGTTGTIAASGRTAATIQAAIRALGGTLADAYVRDTGSGAFYISVKPITTISSSIAASISLNAKHYTTVAGMPGATQAFLSIDSNADGTGTYPDLIMGLAGTATATFTHSPSANTNNGQTTLRGSLVIGNGTVILKHLSGTATWNPASLADAAQTTTTVTVTGAAVGDTVAVGFSQDLQGLQLSGYVSATNTVTVVLRNGTGAAVDLASGTLRADVWQH